jgi:hypothetical protein
MDALWDFHNIQQQIIDRRKALILLKVTQLSETPLRIEDKVFAFCRLTAELFKDDWKLDEPDVRCKARDRIRDAWIAFETETKKQRNFTLLQTRNAMARRIVFGVEDQDMLRKYWFYVDKVLPC